MSLRSRRHSHGTFLTNWIDSETTNLLRRRGCVLIRNVVPDEEAISWEQQLREYITDNPSIVGTSFESPLWPVRTPGS